MSYSGIECDLPEVTRANYLGILLFHTENFEKSSNDDFTMKKMQNTAHVQRTCAHVQCTCAHVQRVDFKIFDSKIFLNFPQRIRTESGQVSIFFENLQQVSNTDLATVSTILGFGNLINIIMHILHISRCK